MATGDRKITAESVAAGLEMTEVHSALLPAGKADLVKTLQAQGRRVAMAGDGVNDAPALAQAEVGIAMGTGTDIAMESSGVTLVKGDLEGILRARAISRASVWNIRENLFFAFVYNALGIPLAAGALYPRVRDSPQPHDRFGGHEPQLRLRDHERPAPAPASAIASGKPSGFRPCGL